MNILTIANAFGDDDVSGVDVVVKSYAKELIDKGHHVDILTRTRTSKSGWRYVEKIPACYVPMTVKRGRQSNVPYQAWANFRKIEDTSDVFKKIGLTGGVLWMHYGSLDALWVGFNAFPELRKVVHIHGVWMRAPSQDGTQAFGDELFMQSKCFIPLRVQHQYRKVGFKKALDYIFLQANGNEVSQRNRAQIYVDLSGGNIN